MAQTFQEWLASEETKQRYPGQPGLTTEALLGKAAFGPTGKPPVGRSDEAALRSMRREGFRGSGATASWDIPSRATVRDMAAASSPEPRDVEKKVREDYAKNEAASVAAGEAPRNTTDPKAPPTDPPEAKVGTGAPLVSHTPAAQRRTAAEQGNGPGIVRIPDGRVIVSTDPAAAAAAGGSIDPPGARSNVASGPAGTVFSSSEKMLIGPGGANLAGVNLPTDEDRSPGWATRKAYNDLYSKGQLSMNPRDIEDRRRFEASEEARESDLELARARRDAAIMQSQMRPTDPYRLAEIEAEAKWGSKAIELEAEQRKISAALGYYQHIGNQMAAIQKQLSEVPPGSAQAAALQETLDRLTTERREWANIAQGFKIQDPEFNPFAAMMGAVAAPAPAPGGSE